jgi:hypothetical protein
MMWGEEFVDERDARFVNDGVDANPERTEPSRSSRR